MLQVPLACDLGQVVPQLASLRNFSGCVELPLRKAAALDPGNMASSPGPEGRAAREVGGLIVTAVQIAATVAAKCCLCNSAGSSNRAGPDGVSGTTERL